MSIVGSLSCHFSSAPLRNIKDILAIGDVIQLLLQSEGMSEGLERTGIFFLQNQKGIYRNFFSSSNCRNQILFLFSVKQSLVVL